MEMNDFQREMALRLKSIAESAKDTETYCAYSDEFEGCVLYEHLLELQVEIEAAITFYRDDVPACSREDITKMVDADRAARDSE